MTGHFVDVTEMDGQMISREQLERACVRYRWAAEKVAGCDVLEVGCGSGQGLSILRAAARSLAAGDVSPEVLAAARTVAAADVQLSEFGAERLPFLDRSFDRILLFEAIYYVERAADFVAEARRVLRPSGQVLLVTANKDLFDFNPSPFSHTYFGVKELAALFEAASLETRFFGTHDVQDVGLRQKLFRPIKFAAARLGLVPKTMGGKEWLKRVVFGQLVPMPASLDGIQCRDIPFVRLPSDKPDKRHKVIYCIATSPNGQA
jgi:SAM-dependent methyltransferase